MTQPLDASTKPSDPAEAVRSAAERRELPAELRAAGFRAGVDERLRLTIRPPTRGQLLCGIVLVVLGGGWTAFVADLAKPSFENAPQQPLLDLVFLPSPALMLMTGLVALAALGVVIIFGRECWTLDRNLLVVRSRLFGWKSEQQFVDGTLNLTRVSRTTEDGTFWSWELQLQNHAGHKLKGRGRGVFGDAGALQRDPDRPVVARGTIRTRGSTPFSGHNNPEDRARLSLLPRCLQDLSARVHPGQRWPADRAELHGGHWAGDAVRRSGGCSIAKITDGTSNTILVVEVGGTGVNWAEPRDLDAVTFSPPFSPPRPDAAGSYRPDGLNVVLADGATRFLSNSTDPTEAQGLITRAEPAEPPP